MTINSIDPASPSNDDPAGFGAAEIRDLKAALKTQFAGNTSDQWDIPITVGPRSINAVDAKADVSDLNITQAQTDQNSLNIVG